MPTIHVAKILIYPLTHTLDMQSKQRCLTKPVSFPFYYHNRYILATKHKHTLLGYFRRPDIKNFLETTNCSVV